MIEVGEYVRTNYGRICKVINNDHFMPRYLECENEMLIDRTNIVKYSKNIIDLIEVGDYVNGQEIIEIRKQNGKIYLMTSYVPQSYINYKIEEILTKEQYEINCYKVGE